MKFCWTCEPPQPVLAGRMAHAQRISPLLAQCLINRGVTEADHVPAYFEPRLKSLSDPFLLQGMREAVHRIYLARDRGETLVVFGDYDVDGVTSTALLLEVFEQLGIKAEYYLPRRLDEGYGLSADTAKTCLSKFPCKLVLAVDCGSSSYDTIAQLKEEGVDVLVLDHHQPCDPLPPALALINPHVPDRISEEPFRCLCSAGLSFKLAHALIKHGRQTGVEAAASFDLRPLLDLVALGTVADIVPLTGENRILVSAGLDRLCATTRPGLVALKHVAQCPAKIGAHEIGFVLGPRLNAAGRLETAEDALELLRARNPAVALEKAEILNGRNAERQAIEKQIVEHAIERVKRSFHPENTLVIVEGDPGWHIGVVGIVAARVLQQFQRPAIILGGDGEHWRGSGRSIAGFDLAGALRGCGDLLVRHGGHAMAAGVTIEPANLDLFRARMNEAARATPGGLGLRPALRLEGEVGLEEITLQSLQWLDKLKPHGLQNPAPQFYTCNLTHHRPLQRMGAQKQHVKMWVTDGHTTHECVWFGAGDGELPVGRFDLAFAPSVNVYNGRSTCQLKVLDWRPAAPLRTTASLQL